MNPRALEIDRFPYPIAQAFVRMPVTDRELRKVRGPAEGIRRAVFCYETITRFCVWEMLME